MDKEDEKLKKQSKAAAIEKAKQLKAEYKRIMNEGRMNSGESFVGKEVQDTASSSSSTSSSSVSNNTKKRKRDSKEEVEIIEVGMRVKSKFDCGDWYEGSVTNVKRGKG